MLMNCKQVYLSITLNKTPTVQAMDDLTEFKKILQQIMSREPKPTMKPEDIQQSIRELEVMELVGDRWEVRLN